MYVLTVAIEKFIVSSQRFFILWTLTAQLYTHLTYFVSCHNYGLRVYSYSQWRNNIYSVGDEMRIIGKFLGSSRGKFLSKLGSSLETTGKFDQSELTHQSTTNQHSYPLCLVKVNDLLKFCQSC